MIKECLPKVEINLFNVSILAIFLVSFIKDAHAHLYFFRFLLLFIFNMIL